MKANLEAHFDSRARVPKNPQLKWRKCRARRTLLHAMRDHKLKRWVYVPSANSMGITASRQQPPVPATSLGAHMSISRALYPYFVDISVSTRMPCALLTPARAHQPRSIVRHVLASGQCQNPVSVFVTRECGGCYVVSPVSNLGTPRPRGSAPCLP